jgi:hypothetical protein
MTDEELKRLVASLAIAQQKTDAQLAKTDVQLAKTDAQLAKTDAQLARTDAQLARTDANLDKLSAKIDRVSTLVGNIANNQGDVAEEFFYRSFLNNPYLGKIHFDTVYRNLPAKKNKLEDEFDVVLVNKNSIVIAEIKQKAHPNLIEDMLTRKLPNFRILFPYYKKLKLYGVIASMVSNQSLIKKCKAAGLFFITQQGEHVVLANDKVKVF